MAVTRTKALILRHSTDREHDRMLVVLTPEYGQMRLRARGTKKSVSKLGGSLEPLTEVELMIADGRVIDQVIGSVIIKNFQVLRQSVPTLVMAQWWLELIERITKPGQAGLELYDLAVRALTTMEAEKDWSSGRQWLALCRRGWEVLAHEGFAPSLQTCAVCHLALAADDAHFHPTHGVVHGHEADPDAWPIHPQVFAYLQQDQTPADERVAWQQLHRLLDVVMLRTLDRPLQSERVLRLVMRRPILSTA